VGVMTVWTKYVAYCQRMLPGGGITYRIINHPCNIGLGGTRNTSIESAAGEYIIFVDSDDWIEPECVSLLYAERMRSGVEVVCGGHDRAVVPSRHPVVSSCHPVPLGRRFVPEDGIGQDCRSPLDSGSSAKRAVGESLLVHDRRDMLMSYFSRSFRVSIWNKLYVVSQLRGCGVRCPHRIMEDNWFTFQLLLCIGSYAIIPEVTYHYTVHEDSITGGGWSESIASQLEVVTVDLLEALGSASLDASLRIEVKERLFRQRIGLSELSLQHNREFRVHIRKYLSISHLLDVDSFRSGVLLSGIFLSLLPLSLKCLLLRYHLRHK
jgi:glycosyltransferase involved in cell wall biosynthesis